MAVKKKKDVAAIRQLFLERAWTILMKYLERLDDEELMQATDARAGAGVVKTLFDAVDKAEDGEPEEDEIELPEIPEAILDEFIDRVLRQKGMARSLRPKGRAERPAVPHPANTECQA